MLVAFLDNTRIEASEAGKGPDYRCPKCRSRLVLRKGRIRVHHFAHKPPVTCSWARGETLAHLAAKRVVRKAFAERGLRAEVEHVVESLSGDRRADVMVWSPKGKPVAIELQHGSMGIEELEARTRSYLDAGTSVVWVPFLGNEAWRNARRLEGGEAGDYLIRRYPARPWERWIHGYNYGRIWFYAPDSSLLWRGRFGKHQVIVDPSHWFDEDGEEHYAGGFPRSSRKWRELTLWGPYEPARLRIEFFPRTKTNIGDHCYPGGAAARFTVEG